MKQTIRLTESELRGMIQETVKEVLTEIKVKTDWYQENDGIEDLHGNDPHAWNALERLRSNRAAAIQGQGSWNNMSDKDWKQYSKEIATKKRNLGNRFDLEDTPENRARGWNYSNAAKACRDDSEKWKQKGRFGDRSFSPID